MKDPAGPDLSRRQARLLLVGVGIFWLGTGVGGWQLSVHRVPVALAAALLGCVLMLGGGGRAFVPTTPGHLRATARLARWPQVPTVVGALGCLAVSLGGVGLLLVPAALSLLR